MTSCGQENMEKWWKSEEEKKIWAREQLFRYDKNFQHSPLFGFCGCGTALRFCHRQWREGRTVTIKCSGTKLFIHSKISSKKLDLGEHHRQSWHGPPNWGWPSCWTYTWRSPIKVLLCRLGKQNRCTASNNENAIEVGYVLGIGWKLFQIYRGNYTPEEPVYLKYK